MAWIWWKPGDAIDAIARAPISYLGVHRVALDRVAAAHLDGLGDGFGVFALVAIRRRCASAHLYDIFSRTKLSSNMMTISNMMRRPRRRSNSKVPGQIQIAEDGHKK